jgi:hypothetical protein
MMIPFSRDASRATLARLGRVLALAIIAPAFFTGYRGIT